MTPTAGAPANILVGRDISVKFGGLVVLSGVCIEVPEATIVGLIGPNGAGKSTLIGVLSGLIKPEFGSVLMQGTDVTKQRPEQRARHGLARTFQQPELFAGLTVREHLILSWRVQFDRKRLWSDLLNLRGWMTPATTESDRIDYLLDRLKIADISHAPVTALPLGLSRLVEVGRALAASPKVVLLDEPLSGLDAGESETLAGALRDLVADEGVSFLLIDHDVDIVLAQATRVVVLDFGQVIANGSPAEVRSDDCVRAAYLGDAIGVGEGVRYA
jgi:branched-chain amino acid transport system ATP-binding protein